MLDTSSRGRRLKPALPSPKIRLTHSPTTVTTHLCAMTYENFTSRSIVTVITGTCHGSSARDDDNSNRTAQPHRNLDRSPIGTDYILFHCVHRHPPTRSARLLIFSVLENTVLRSR
ncbi:Uncharacterised protein [Mycobacteroides abscessus subsp. massiliense]|nr:Uncharacterised protein [Mycobacteroides abscessus subsp. massiliense]SKV01812.1 Uncharacterised protein [Mycobacteroides abscessus subsp. massiliense]